MASVPKHKKKGYARGRKHMLGKLDSGMSYSSVMNQQYILNVSLHRTQKTRLSIDYLMKML